MAINQSLLISAAMLQDFIINKVGEPLVQGIITLYQDNDRTTLKNWYYLSGSPGSYTYITLPNPLTLSASGTICDVNGVDTIPFYYPVSELDPSQEELYYITVDDQFGTRQFTRQNFPFGSGEGTVTQAVPNFENLIVNGQFWRNIGSLSLNSPTTVLPNSYSINLNGTPTTLYYKTIAPSQHDGFTMPDITFNKGVNTGQDTITFQKFLPSLTPSLQEDVTPEFYIEHTSGSQPGQTYKFYQIPISLHLATLTGQSGTVTIQAKNNGSTGNDITLYLFSFAGTGGNSPIFTQLATPFITTPNWTKYFAPIDFPSTSGISIGTGGDDAYYLLIGIDLSSSVDVSFTLPSIYLNDQNQVPTNSFTDYDQVNSIISSPRTGDIRISINSFNPFGWVPMNDGTIGNSSSNATASKSNDLTWPLFQLIWNLASPYSASGGGTSNSIAQMYSSTGTAVGYGPNISVPTTAYADFIANNQLSLTKAMGQVLMGTVPLSSLLTSTASISGFKSVFTAPQITQTFTGSNSSLNLLLTSTIPLILGEVVQVSNVGGALPNNLSAATPYYAIPVSPTTFYLALSLSDAQSGIAILWGSNGTGTNSVTTFSLVLTTSNPTSLFIGEAITFTNTSGALPTGINATTVYFAGPSSTTTFCVASSFQNAIQGNFIAWTDVGSGTNTVYASTSGQNIGQYKHTQLVPEIASHTHQLLVQSGSGAATPTANVGSLTSYPTLPNGESVPFNITQPSTFMNLFIKL